MQIVPVREDLVTYLQTAVGVFFPKPVEDYRQYTAPHYHTLVALGQKCLREKGLAQELADSVSHDLPKKYTLGALYLRATRPLMGGQESVGWHREEFYGAPKGALNFWMPVRGVTRENTLQYVPGSETAQVLLEDDGPDSVVTKGSAGNEIGLLYSPKRIVSGVDFSKAQPMEVPLGSAVIFSGSLIHGAAVNRGPDIRFSVDFRIYPEGAV